MMSFCNDNKVILLYPAEHQLIKIYTSDTSVRF